MCACVYDAVGKVLAVLPEGEPVTGISSLDNSVYILRGRKESKQVEVYELYSPCLKKTVTIEGLGHGQDIVVCGNSRCIYVSDSDMCIRKVHVENTRNGYQWPVDGEPGALSLTGRQTLLVVFSSLKTIQEYSYDGQRMDTIRMGHDIGLTPQHVIGMSEDEFLLCGNDRKENPHVELGSSALKENTIRFSGKKGSGEGKLSVPNLCFRRQ